MLGGAVDAITAGRPPSSPEQARSTARDVTLVCATTPLPPRACADDRIAPRPRAPRRPHPPPPTGGAQPPGATQRYGRR